MFWLGLLIGLLIGMVGTILLEILYFTLTLGNYEDDE